MRGILAFNSHGRGTFALRKELKAVATGALASGATEDFAKFPVAVSTKILSFMILESF